MDRIICGAVLTIVVSLQYDQYEQGVAWGTEKILSRNQQKFFNSPDMQLMDIRMYGHFGDNGLENKFPNRTECTYPQADYNTSIRLQNNHPGPLLLKCGMT